MRNDHVLYAFTVTIFLINFRPKLPHCHVLQMTASNCLKLGILALQFINRKSIKNNEYMITGYHFVSI